VDFGILGPLEVSEAGQPQSVGGTKQRALLALLLLHPNQIVSSGRLIDELWGEEPPQSGGAALQVRVSQLRKALGPGGARLETRAPGYLLRVERDELDLHRFERLTEEAARSEPAEAAELLQEALGLWRGSPLVEFAYESFAQAAIGRLEELRLAAIERKIAAELALGRHAELVPQLEGLVREHPLREGLHAQLMLALYRSGRQAEALEAFQRARRSLDSEVGLVPGPALRELERQILRHDSALELARPTASLPTILVLDGEAPLAELAESLAREPAKEVLYARLVGTAAALDNAAAAVERRRAQSEDRGVTARGAAFVSADPAGDVVRIAVEQDVDLVLLAVEREPLSDDTVGQLLERAPCDVGLFAEGVAGGERILVPFVGAEHDWAAVEIAAWLARSAAAPLVLAGPAEGDGGRDSSRLLANASLAVQRALGVSAAPLLLKTGRDPLVTAAEASGAVVLGLGERWRQEGLGAVRQAVAARTRVPILFVRRGLRPGGLAPREALTRFTWSWRS
jgi:DNA-binding SARP family transcriptional activator